MCATSGTRVGVASTLTTATGGSIQQLALGPLSMPVVSLGSSANFTWRGCPLRTPPPDNLLRRLYEVAPPSPTALGVGEGAVDGGDDGGEAEPYVDPDMVRSPRPPHPDEIEAQRRAKAEARAAMPGTRASRARRRQRLAWMAAVAPRVTPVGSRAPGSRRPKPPSTDDLTRGLPLYDSDAIESMVMAPEGTDMELPGSTDDTERRDGAASLTAVIHAVVTCAHVGELRLVGRRRVAQRLLRLAHPPARLVVGPVVGAVSATSAVVLAETAKPSVVRCVLTDVLTGIEHVATVSLGPGPGVARFTTLQPHRRYSVAFDGVVDSSRRTGMVTTLSHCPRTLNVVGVSGTAGRVPEDVHAVDMAYPMTDPAHATSERSALTVALRQLESAAGDGSGADIEGTGDCAARFAEVVSESVEDAVRSLPRAGPLGALSNAEAPHLWRRLLRRVVEPWGVDRVDVVVHLGNQVDVRHILESAHEMLEVAEAEALRTYEMQRREQVRAQEQWGAMVAWYSLTQDICARVFVCQMEAFRGAEPGSTFSDVFGNEDGYAVDHEYTSDDDAADNNATTTDVSPWVNPGNRDALLGLRPAPDGSGGVALPLTPDADAALHAAQGPLVPLPVYGVPSAAELVTREGDLVAEAEARAQCLQRLHPHHTRDPNAPTRLAGSQLQPGSSNWVGEPDGSARFNFDVVEDFEFHGGADGRLPLRCLPYAHGTVGAIAAGVSPSDVSGVSASAAERKAVLEALRPGLLARILDDVREQFRDAYRKAWNVPYVRDVLANTCNVMLPAAADICPGLLAAAGLPEGELQDGSPLPSLLHRYRPELVAIAKEVHAQYQLPLWQASPEVAGDEQPAMQLHRWGATVLACVDVVSSIVHADGSVTPVRCTLHIACSHQVTNNMCSCVWLCVCGCGCLYAATTYGVPCASPCLRTAAC